MNKKKCKLPEVESRTQGSRPRTQKKSEAKAKDSLSEDRHSRGQGTGMLEAKAKDQGHKRWCSPKKKKKKKKGLHENFLGDLQIKKKKKKKGLHKNFSGDLHKKTFSKEFFKRFTIFEDLRPRGRGLDLQGQGQGLQNVSSRTFSRPRTSSRTPPL